MEEKGKNCRIHFSSITNEIFPKIKIHDHILSQIIMDQNHREYAEHLELK